MKCASASTSPVGAEIVAFETLRFAGVAAESRLSESILLSCCGFSEVFIESVPGIGGTGLGAGGSEGPVKVLQTVIVEEDVAVVATEVAVDTRDTEDSFAPLVRISIRLLF